MTRPPAAALPLLLAATFACRTVETVDLLAPGTPRGIVELHGEGGVTILLADGGTLGPFTLTGKSTRIACPPGKHRVRSAGTKYVEAALEVAADRVTAVASEFELLESHSYQVSVYATEDRLQADRREGSTSRALGREWRSSQQHRVLLSVGRPILPAADEPPDLGALAAALQAEDWGTQAAALERVYWIKPLPPRLAELLPPLVRDDAHKGRVASRAEHILDHSKLEVPFFPIHFDRFRVDPYGEWWTGDDRDGAASFTGESYRLASKSGLTVFRGKFPSLWGASQAELDVVLECAWEEGARDAPFGLALVTSRNQRYNLTATKDGTASARLVDRASVIPLAGGKGRIGSVSERRSTRIELARRKTDYTMRVNGEVVGAFVSEPDTTFTKIGIIARGRQTISCTRLSIAISYSARKRALGQ